MSVLITPTSSEIIKINEGPPGLTGPQGPSNVQGPSGISPTIPSNYPYFQFIATGIKTYVNATGFENMVDGGMGSKIVPANSITTGTSFLLKGAGLVSTEHATSSSTLVIKFGNTTLVSSTAVLPRDLTGALYQLDFAITFCTCGPSGRAVGQGRTIVDQGIFANAVTRPLIMGTGMLIDTTIDNEISVQYNWTKASPENSISTTNSYIERIY